MVALREGTMRVEDARQSVSATAAAPADVVSVIVPVLHDEMVRLIEAFRAYKGALERSGRPLDFIYVAIPGTPQALEALRTLKAQDEPVRVIVLGQGDEGAALRRGFQEARGQIVLTLPDHLQVEPEDLGKVLDALEGCDMVVAERSTGEGIQGSIFHWLIQALFGQSFNDLVCRVRACRRAVLEEITGYSAQHHFLPLLAADRSFRIRVVEVRGRLPDQPRGGRLGFVRRWLLTPVRMALDVLALYMVLKFIRKPLRFFGAIGVPILFVGTAYTGALGIARLFFGVPLADRPALILGVLLIVLGIQIIALGLIGEIIIFAAGKRIKDYTVEKVL